MYQISVESDETISYITIVFQILRWFFYVHLCSCVTYVCVGAVFGCVEQMSFNALNSEIHTDFTNRSNAIQYLDENTNRIHV